MAFLETWGPGVTQIEEIKKKRFEVIVWGTCMSILKQIEAVLLP